MSTAGTNIQDYTFQSRHTYFIGVQDGDSFTNISGSDITRTDVGIEFEYSKPPGKNVVMDGIALQDGDKICLSYHEITFIVERQ